MMMDVMNREQADPPPAPLLVAGATALIYLCLGLLSLWLAQSVGLAAPIYPAAGAAFVAGMLWRWPGWLGVFFGAVGVNAIWLGRLGAPADIVWSTAGAIAVGSALQAAIAGVAVRRLFGARLCLDTPANITGTLLIAGPLACGVAATIGVSIQLANGLLAPSAAAAGWLTWWSGDAIGVIVFTPLALMALPSQRPHWVGRRGKIAIPTLVLTGALGLAIAQDANFARSYREEAVADISEEAESLLQGNLNRHLEVLEGLRAFLNTSDSLSADTFDRYTADFLVRFPNLQALSWNPVVTATELAAFEASMRLQPGLESFAVTEQNAGGGLGLVSPRPEYVVVAYIEPLASNSSAIGFDVLSNPARAKAIHAARDTGRATATSPIDLVQESGRQMGMLTLLPIYRDGRVPPTPSERRQAIRGFAVGVYRLESLLRETFADAAWDGVQVTLVDISERAQPVPIADLAPRDVEVLDEISSAPSATSRPLEVFGRMWELTVRPTSKAIGAGRRPMTTLLMLAGLGVGLLMEAFLLTVSSLDLRSRRDAEVFSFEALHDPLTSLPNRRAFFRALERWEKAEAPETKASTLLFCDLDGFKRVNDEAGHLAGDAFLREVARVLQARMRTEDQVARIGGDEFAVLLRHCPRHAAMMIANELIASVEVLRLPPPLQHFSISVSVGATVLRHRERVPLEDHLNRADQACYEAKRSGRGRVRFFA